MLRRQHDAVDFVGDVAVDDADLLEHVVFLERTVPDDLRGDALLRQVLSRALGAALDRLPEFMRQSLGNDGDAVLGFGLVRAATASQDDRENHC